MMPLRRAAAIAAAAVTLSACASTAAPAAKSTTAAHVLPPGCRSALLVTAAVRSHLETDPGDTHGALRQLNGLEKSLSSGQLQVDTAFAAERLARFQLDATMGQSTAGDAKSFASALSKISRDCRA